MTPGAQFWRSLQELLASHRIVIDRPAGSAHPRFPDYRYPLDYGYLEGTRGGDGQGIDVWLGSGDRNSITGVICTVDPDKRDAELKLLAGCTPSETETILRAHNFGRQSGILVKAPLDSGGAPE